MSLLIQTALRNDWRVGIFDCSVEAFTETPEELAKPADISAGAVESLERFPHSIPFFISFLLWSPVDYLNAFGNLESVVFLPLKYPGATTCCVSNAAGVLLQF